MNNRFKSLKIFSVIFKVTAGVLFTVIGIIGTVAILVGKDLPQGTPRWTAVFTFLQGAFWFLVFYAVGEIIRILCAIEEQTRKQ